MYWRLLLLRVTHHYLLARIQINLGAVTCLRRRVTRCAGACPLIGQRPLVMLASGARLLALAEDTALPDSI